MDGALVAALTLIAAYDVREDDRRSRLAAVLQTVGDRVQKSVFMVMVDETGLLELKHRALRIIDTNTDSLMFFRQCGGCWDSQLMLGQGRVPHPVTHWVVL